MAASGGLKVWVFVAVAFVGGMVFGGIGPRAELRELEEEVFELKRRMSASGGPGRELAALFTRGLDAVEAAGSDAPQKEPTNDAPNNEETEDDETPAAEPQPVKHSELDRLSEPESDEGPPDFDIEEAAELMDVRAAQARAALFEDIDPSDAQIEAIDAAVIAMNKDLAELAWRFVDDVREHGEPDRLEAMMVGSDALEVLIQTENAMLDSLSDDQIANLRRDGTDPSSFLDASLLEAVGELQNLGFDP